MYHWVKLHHQSHFEKSMDSCILSLDAWKYANSSGDESTGKMFSKILNATGTCTTVVVQWEDQAPVTSVVLNHSWTRSSCDRKGDSL
jgi:hypothetical protein